MGAYRIVCGCGARLAVEKEDEGLYWESNWGLHGIPNPYSSLRYHRNRIQDPTIGPHLPLEATTTARIPIAEGRGSPEKNEPTPVNPIFCFILIVVVAFKISRCTFTALPHSSFYKLLSTLKCDARYCQYHTYHIHELSTPELQVSHTHSLRCSSSAGNAWASILTVIFQGLLFIKMSWFHVFFIYCHHY